MEWCRWAGILPFTRDDRVEGCLGGAGRLEGVSYWVQVSS